MNVPVDRRDLRRRLFALAADQAGYFSAAQAKALGYSYPAQAHHVNAGNWLRVDRGIFRLVDWVPDVHDDLARWVLWSKHRAVVSHETALGVYGVGEFESPRVHLTVPRNFRMSHDAVVLHQTDLPDDDTTTGPGFRLTTLTRSLIDVAAGHADPDQLARALGEATALGTFTQRQLRSRAEAVDTTAALRIERALQLLDRP
jgi:predicted transcriptional regulator of viral defense system